MEAILGVLGKNENTIVSGTVMNWGQPIEDLFDVIGLLYRDAVVRVQRLRHREEQELGLAAPEFAPWASEYDEGPATGGRSLKRHLQWLAQRSCRIVKIEGDWSLETRFNRLVASLPNETGIRSGRFDRNQMEC